MTGRIGEFEIAKNGRPQNLRTVLQMPLSYIMQGKDTKTSGLVRTFKCDNRFRSWHFRIRILDPYI